MIVRKCHITPLPHIFLLQMVWKAPAKQTYLRTHVLAIARCEYMSTFFGLINVSREEKCLIFKYSYEDLNIVGSKL